MLSPSFSPAQELLAAAKKRAEEHELLFLHPKAAFSKDQIRFHPDVETHPFSYKIDVQRILHSKAYARYADKTQVVYLVENDHITHRGLHVQLVSCFARGIAAVLQLNQDLVEAIALGHDVGHPPFGHEGEGYLSHISRQHGNGPFTHSLHSCRLFTHIEPLNLSFAVYDGFLCHDGGMGSSILSPHFGKTWERHYEEQGLKHQNPETNIMPGTLEGCLVKLCDTVTYIAKDLEDAISLGILKREEIPPTILGVTNAEILRFVAQDLIKHSFGQEHISISQNTFQALQVLRRFNFEKIYTHPKLKVESEKVRNSYSLLFNYLLADLEEKKKAATSGASFFLTNPRTIFPNPHRCKRCWITSQE